MKLSSMMLCRHVEIQHNLLYIHGGGINRFEWPKFPIQMAVGIVAVLQADENDHGEKTSIIVLRDEDGKILQQTEPFVVTLNDTIRSITMGYMLPLFLGTPGHYQFQAVCNGKLIGSHALVATIAGAIHLNPDDSTPP